MNEYIKILLKVEIIRIKLSLIDDELREYQRPVDPYQAQEFPKTREKLRKQKQMLIEKLLRLEPK